MASVSEALEREVAAIREIRREREAARTLPGMRERARLDRHYANLLRLIAPRIRYFVRQYGLLDMREDAEQVCALAVHRAVEAYDPAKARFTTFVTWQLRGELQGLRFRMRSDQRDGAKKVGATTISLETPLPGGAGSLADFLVDEAALDRAERLASDVLATRTCHALLDDYFARMREAAGRRLERRRVAKPGTLAPADLARLEAKLARERAILAHYLLGESDAGDGGVLTSEQKRQVARRACRTISRRAPTLRRFNPELPEQQARTTPQA